MRRMSRLCGGSAELKGQKVKAAPLIRFFNIKTDFIFLLKPSEGLVFKLTTVSSCRKNIERALHQWLFIIRLLRRGLKKKLEPKPAEVFGAVRLKPKF